MPGLGYLMPVPRRGRVIRFPGVAASPPPGPRGSLSRDVRELVEVYRGPHAEAVVVKSFLESEGIPALLRSQLSQAVYPFSVGRQGEVAILVPREEGPRGRRLLLRAQ